MRARAQRIGATLLVLAALTSCGDEPTPAAGGATAPSAAPTRPAASPEPSGEVVAAADGEPSAVPVAEPVAEPVEEPDAPPGPAPAADGPDLDGDGRADAVSLVAVPDTGWSFDVRLADGRETSAPLPDDGLVREDVAVVGPVDLDRDGADEVLVRTLRAVGGENAVVFRLDGDGVWLVRDQDGAPFELSTSGGMTGPRSWACADGELLTRESERQADGTYRAMTWRWTLTGRTAGPLGGAREDAVAADDVSLDHSTCDT